MNLKNTSLAVVIVSIALFTLISLLAIWDVIEDSDFVWKSLMSLAVVGFSGLVGVALGERMHKTTSTTAPMQDTPLR